MARRDGVRATSEVERVSVDVPPLADDDPEQVGGYRLLGRLGQGGMGRVFLAEDGEGHRVAVKIVHEEFAANPEFRSRFRREVEAAERVLGYFTVPLVDAGPDAETPWLATQFVPGPALGTAVRRDGPMPLAELCTLAAALSEALIVIHAAGVVHRDLKPSNVLLGEDGPRVIDFGIARAADAEDLTRSGAALGTLGYAAPELFLADGPVGPAADVFALGGVLLFAATGRDPFGDGPQVALVFRTVHLEPDLTGVPAPLVGLIERCLDKDPAGRPTPRQVLAAARAAQSRVERPAQPPLSVGEFEATSGFDEAEETLGTDAAGEITLAVPVAGYPEPSRPARPPNDRAPGRSPGFRRSLRARIRTSASTSTRTRRLGLVVAGVAGTTALAIVALLALPDGGGGAGTGTGRPTAPVLAAAASGGDPLPPIAVEGNRQKTWSAMTQDADLDSAVVGLWLTTDVLVRIDASGVRAYDPAKGNQRWAVASPVEGMVPCSASQGRTATSGGIGVVGYGKAYSDPVVCEDIAALDIATGRLLWHRSVGRPPGGRRIAAVAGDTFVVAGEEGLVGLERATGLLRWTYRWVNGDCRVTDVRPGPSAIAVAEFCEPPNRGALTTRLLELDPAGGTERRRQEVSAWRAAGLVGADPLVAHYSDDSGWDHLVSFPPNGGPARDVRSEVSVDAFKGDMYATPELLIARVKSTNTGFGPDAEDLVAIELATGKLRWRQVLPTAYGFELLAFEADSMVTVEPQAPQRSDILRVTRRDLSNGVVSASGGLPTAYAEHSFADYVVAAGALVVRVDDQRRPGLVAFEVPPD
ncbi:protein kinase domain-containing protein [Embleya sp. NBC_00896]|uniref:serine/threonine-protein kinase n=1 Tax=Embleya sp. NBC_00896 TaxID=2975961 RepID=UPI002F90E4B3|nr:serine/threonine-protein kinase [Embleya sp. NBC_00896]